MTADLSAELVRAIATNLSETFDKIPEWDELAMVIELNGARYSAGHGYVYSTEGESTPVAPSVVQRR